jgi:hypothetical protein
MRPLFGGPWCRPLAGLIRLGDRGRIGEIQISCYLSVLDRKNVHNWHIDPLVGGGDHRAVTTDHHHLVVVGDEFLWFKGLVFFASPLEIRKTHDELHLGS